MLLTCLLLAWLFLCLPLEPVKPFQFFLPRRTGWLIRPTSLDKLPNVQCCLGGQFAEQLELRLLVQGGGGGAGDNGVSDITLAQ